MPVNLAILFGAAALAAFAGKEEIIEQSIDRDIVIRPLYRWNTGWLAHELLSTEAFQAVGSMLDLDLMSYWPSVKTGLFKVVAITQIGGPPGSHIIVILEGHGKYGWSLSEAYHRSYGRVQTKSMYQLIAELIDQLNTDPAKEVVSIAVDLPPGKRFIYLRQALMANPVLSALLASDEGFKALVMSTVATPEAQAIKAKISAHQRLPVERRLIASTIDMPTAFATGVITGEEILDSYPDLRASVLEDLDDDRSVHLMLASVQKEVESRYPGVSISGPSLENLTMFMKDGLQHPSSGETFFIAFQKWAKSPGYVSFIPLLKKESDLVEDIIALNAAHGRQDLNEDVERYYRTRGARRARAAKAPQATEEVE